MTRESVILNAKDCLRFDNQDGHANAFQYFISRSSNYTIFRFDPNSDIDDIEIANFNHHDASWYAGRLVGEANFTFEETNYTIRIEPRFGQLQLFRMLEEIYNIRLIDSKSSIDNEIDYQLLIKRLIAFMWMSMLAKANKHGLPRINITRTHKGSTIKGKLNIRKSIIPYYTESQVISEYREKQSDQTIVKILFKAYEILRLEYGLAKIKQPSAAKNAIEQIKASLLVNDHMSDYDYQTLRLKPIYASWRSVIDLSWDIIKKKQIGNTDSDKDGQSFFIDMAELWEIYLRSIIKKKFASDGWSVSSPKSKIYSSKDYSRNIIPDIVMHKGASHIVLDAKYKRMNFDYYDYDRTDFFQIHTYINYYQQRNRVLFGGLLYPLSKMFDDERVNSNYSESLYEEGYGNTKFIIDGIDFSSINEENIKLEETKFLNRISSVIHQANV